MEVSAEAREFCALQTAGYCGDRLEDLGRTSWQQAEADLAVCVCVCRKSHFVLLGNFVRHYLKQFV